jgi:hypothetical protein
MSAAEEEQIVDLMLLTLLRNFQVTIFGDYFEQSHCGCANRYDYVYEFNMRGYNLNSWRVRVYHKRSIFLARLKAKKQLLAFLQRER